MTSQEGRPRGALLRAIAFVVTVALGRRRLRKRRGAEPPDCHERGRRPNRRAENSVVVLLLAAAGCAAVFMAFYVANPNNQLLGLSIGLSLAFFAAASVIAGKRVVPQEKAVEDLHLDPDRESEREVLEIVRETGEGISRRRLMIGAAGAASVTLGAAALFPIASLGPRVDDVIRSTPWRRGRRVVDEGGKVILADELEMGTFLTGFPEGADKEDIGSPIIIVRLPVSGLALPGGNESAPEGIVAYSKICTHAGCAVSMYRDPLFPATEPRPALVCPCHYSTFDPAAGAHVLYGPAARPLPQLPLALTPKRELVADGNFIGTVGPTYGESRLK